MTFDMSRFSTTRNAPAGDVLATPEENAADYDALRLALYAEHQPATEDEAMLVERIAQNWWKLQRAERYETHILSCANGFEVFNTVTMTNFMRYRNAIERAWKNARKELAALAAKRTPDTAAPLESAQPAAVAASTKPAVPAAVPAPTPVHPPAARHAAARAA